MDTKKQSVPSKEGAKSFFRDLSQGQATDQKLMEHVQWELNQQQQFHKLHQGWYFVTAGFLLLISVSAGLVVYNYKGEQTNQPVQAMELPSKSIIDQEPLLATAGALNKTETISNPAEVEQKSEAAKPSVAAITESFKEIKSSQTVSSHTLTDGSVITLHDGAVASVATTFETNRMVKLEGEAYFEVKPDSKHPFEVHFDNYILKVLGTKFNVRSIKGESTKEVTVTEGHVMVYDKSSSKTVELTKGKQLKLTSGKEPMVSEVDASNFIAWKTGQLEFNKAKLESVMAVLSRTHKVEISLSPALKNCKFTGDLSGLTVSEGLEIIKMSTSVNVEKSNNKIFVSGKGCE